MLVGLTETVKVGGGEPVFWQLTLKDVLALLLPLSETYSVPEPLLLWPGPSEAL